MKKTDKIHPRGFTLVELAIVMVVIGLLIGGILKGQAMIDNARFVSFIKQVDSYRAAQATFHSKYNVVAGDMLNATNVLPGCNAANHCSNGNGNSRVNGNGAAIQDPAYNTAVDSWVETGLFWKHLALADMITGVDFTANIASPAWGTTHPSSKLGGGFEFYFDPLLTTTGGAGITSTGDVLRFSQGGVTGAPIGQNGTSPLTPREAAYIDRKMDDGNGNKGWVIVEDAGNVCVRSLDGEYREDNEGKDCILFFRF